MATTPNISSADAIPMIAFAQIEPVGQCNLRCRMCPIQFRRDGPPHGPLAFMPLAVFRRLIDQLPALETLHLQGLGEPLMHPQFFDMVQYAAARGIVVSTNSNLTLLSRRRAALCVASGLHELHASLDAAAPEIFERIRVRARLSRVRRHLDALMQARAAAGSRYPRVRIVVVLMRDNLNELAAIVRLAHAHGVASVFVQHLCHDFRESTLPEHYRPMREFVAAQTLLRVDPMQIEDAFALARAEAERLGVQLRLPQTRVRAARDARVGRSRCDWPWKGPYISYRGEAMPCCMVGTPDRINFGNMAEQGVDTLWNGTRYQAFRRALESNDPPAVCRACSVYNGVF